MPVADLDERPWFVFAMPHGCVTYVPAATEEAARELMRRNCYDKAPVESWPLIGTRFTSRERLSKELLRMAAWRKEHDGS